MMGRSPIQMRLCRTEQRSTGGSLLQRWVLALAWLSGAVSQAPSGQATRADSAECDKAYVLQCVVICMGE